MYKFARKGLGDRFWTLVIEIVNTVQKRVWFPRFSTGTVRPVDTPTQAVVNLWNSWVIYPFWVLFMMHPSDYRRIRHEWYLLVPNRHR